MLAGNTQEATTAGESLYQKAKAADDAGKSKRAIKEYDKMATRYPSAPSAPQARFRQAQLLEERGEIGLDEVLHDRPGRARFELAVQVPQ